jgi:mycothiol system anti-sigma-R factor
LNCQRTGELLPGYLDGELDLSASLEFEQHLEACERCARSLKNQAGLRSLVKESGPYYPAPARLRKQIRSSLRKAGKVENRPAAFSWKWVVVAALVACALFAGLSTWRVLNRRALAQDDVLAQELVSDHVRSLMVDHLTDVNSSDQHTVKPWFDGKLDFAPPVKDFADQGFPLLGGRLEYVNGRTVAALVFQRQKHYINVFIWPVEHGADSGTQLTVRQGYNLAHWTKSGMTFWAVSDLNGGDLEALSKLIQEQTPPPK